MVMRDKSSDTAVKPISDLATLGDGEVAYIRVLSTAQAKRMFPAIRTLPKGIPLFAVHSANGTPICLADSAEAAMAFASEGELHVASIH